MNKKLFHDVPSWVPDDAIFFLTICCAIRNVNTLCKPDIAELILQSVRHYQDSRKWWPYFVLFMPDHVHILVAFEKENTITNAVRSWKRFLSRKHKIDWQEDFFDHRIRNDEQLAEKDEYIRYNPVRKKLVDNPENWPYRYPR